MTRAEKEFIEEQLHIIDNKIDEDGLHRYATLLSVAHLTEEIRGYLKRAVDKKLEEMNPDTSPMVENGDISDFN